MEKEQWRDIPGYEGLYQVSDLGRVKSLARNVPSKKEGYTNMSLKEKLLTARINPKGYYKYALYKNNIQKNFSAHILVMLVFVGKRPNDFETNHINGIKKDNRLCNLEYVTAKQNTQHALTVLGRKRHGEFASRSKLKTKDVLEIRKRLKLGERLCDLAREYSVTPAYLHNLRAGKTWRHLL